VFEVEFEESNTLSSEANTFLECFPPRIQLGQAAAVCCRVSMADQTCAGQERQLWAFARKAHRIVDAWKKTAKEGRAERKQVLLPPRPVARVWCGFQFALITCFLVATPILAATHDSPLPSDAQIRQMLVTRIDVQHRGTGAILVIVTPTGLRTIAYGSVAKGDKRPVDGDTVFGVASITKLFTALLLTDMARHGEVGLADPAGQDLPAMENRSRSSILRPTQPACR
jgi:hypothetical protein